MVRPNPAGARTMQSLLPFVPARDFSQSTRFYADLGFTVSPISDDVAEVYLGECAFYLQNFYVREWAANFVLHAHVDSLDAWWKHINSLDLANTYRVQEPRAPKLEPWGLRVAYVFDPSGVLWHFAEVPA